MLRIIGLALAFAVPEIPRAAADCRGRDLLDQLKVESPATFAALEAEASALPFGRSRLFRLSREGSGPSYLFGTVHVADPRAALSAQTHAALINSKLVAVESTDLGRGVDAQRAESGAEVRSAMLASEKQQPSRLLGRREFARLEAAVVRRGLPATAARLFKPSVIALVLDTPPCALAGPERGNYVDAVVMGAAHESRIPVVGLETLIEQLEILDGLPAEAERNLLIAAVRKAERAEDILETAVSLYAAGNIGGLLSWMSSPEPVPGVPRARTPPAFLERILDARTRRMRDRVLPFLARGHAFIAVGAAHLPGEDGLARLLEKEGYRVEALERNCAEALSC